MFVNICACIYVLGNMGKYNPPSIVDLNIYLLGHFALIIFVVCCTLFSYTDTATEFTMHTESVTA